MSGQRVHPDPQQQQVLAVVGATGTGKSDAALAAAESLGAEIVAVDAFTVYRGMDIGTAKPDPRVREAVPHHLVDVLDPAQDCTAQWFQAAARAAIDDVRARGRVPLLVGGSGLYFRAVVDPLEFPPTDAVTRRELEARWDDDHDGAHAALAAVDPAAAERIDPRNVRRTVRALEVFELTGRPFSQWWRAWGDYRSRYDDLVIIGLDVSRDELRDRLDARLDAMLAAGWLDECRGLLEGPLSRTARQAIGYADLFAHLEGRLTLAEAVERVRTRTRQYATRQQRWFRADPRVRWLGRSAAPRALLEAAER